MLLESQGKSLLIDCGSDIRFSLYDQGLDYDDIDALFISHLHGDHAGGVEWLSFQRKFASKREKPDLYGARVIVDDLWKKVLSGSLSSLENEQADLSTYFKVHPIENTPPSFDWEGIHFELIKTLHCMSNDQPMPSYGLMIESAGHKVLISGDIQFHPEKMMRYYEEADLIFHDCETITPPTSVHAPYTDLASLPEKIKNKMWLYHYNDGSLPPALLDGFKGFVRRGQRFDV